VSQSTTGGVRRRARRTAVRVWPVTSGRCGLFSGERRAKRSAMQLRSRIMRNSGSSVRSAWLLRSSRRRHLDRSDGRPPMCGTQGSSQMPIHQRTPPRPVDKQRPAWRSPRISGRSLPRTRLREHVAGASGRSRVPSASRGLRASGFLRSIATGAAARRDAARSRDGGPS
jgi:hypothetical protein